MINVKRRSEPEFFRSQLVERERTQAKRVFKPLGKPSERSFSFTAYLSPEVLTALNNAFHGKCAYCESPIASLHPSNIEHHRPRARALDLDGSVAFEHYWWLACEWTNLLLVCNDCTRAKGSRFPVTGRRADPDTDVKKEKALLLDPCRDHPEKHLVFSEDGNVHSETERGQLTIEVFGLNRTSLVAQRADSYQRLAEDFAQTGQLLLRRNKEPANEELSGQVEQELTRVRRYLAPGQPYGALHRQFVNRWLHALGAAEGAGSEQAEPLRREAARKTILVTEAHEHSTVDQFSEYTARQQSYSVEADDAAQKGTFFSGAKRLEWFEIRNFKGIERLRLEFPTPTNEREPWLMLLGENGTGKSSILQALALALMGKEHASALNLDASDYVRADAGRSPGLIQVKLTSIPEPIVVRFRKGSREFVYDTADPKVLLLGYGATRLLRPRLGASDWAPSYIRVMNLFKPTAPLEDVESWLLDRKAVDNRRFNAIAGALKDLLMLESDERLSRSRDEVSARVGRHPPVSLHQLSDGFQSVVALSVDVMKILLERWPSVEDAEGIVLLDELEAHLHPTWKIEIVERLRRTFPRVAFVVSTHDPLCLKGLQQGEIVLLRRDEQRTIVADTQLPAVNDLRADQILTSILFGLHSTRGDDTVGAIDRYASLLGKQTLSPAEDTERGQLLQRLQPTLTPQQSELGRIVEKAIWQTLVETPEASLSPPATPATTAELSPEMLELRRQLEELLGSETAAP